MAERRGNPGKLNEETIAKLLVAIEGGNYYEPACHYAGISYSTLRVWILRAEAELDRVAGSSRRHIRKREAPYVEFLGRLTLAEARGEVRMVTHWQKVMPEDWRAVRDFLQRRYPDRWGRRELGLDVKADIPGNVTITQINVPAPLPEPGDEEMDGDESTPVAPDDLEAEAGTDAD